MALAALTSTAHAAPFDDVKGYLASCLRFEMDAPAAQGLALAARTRLAVGRCGAEVERVDRADGRRLRGDGGVSPSTKAVILGVMGRGGAADGVRNVRY